MLSQPDYEAFHAIVHSSAYSSDDFEIATVDYVDRLERMYPAFTRVFILHKRTNITTRYVAGCSSYWLRIFEKDIENGTFKII